jgi:hypothetical protein
MNSVKKNPRIDIYNKLWRNVFAISKQVRKQVSLHGPLPLQIWKHMSDARGLQGFAEIA